jgi:hypothetical protein
VGGRPRSGASDSAAVTSRARTRRSMWTERGAVLGEARRYLFGFRSSLFSAWSKAIVSGSPSRAPRADVPRIPRCDNVHAPHILIGPRVVLSGHRSAPSPWARGDGPCGRDIRILERRRHRQPSLPRERPGDGRGRPTAGTRSRFPAPITIGAGGRSTVRRGRERYRERVFADVDRLFNTFA